MRCFPERLLPERATTRAAAAMATLSILFWGGASVAAAFDGGEGTSAEAPRGFSADPLVGTLPVQSAGIAHSFDQTITLRGTVQALRDAIVAVRSSGGEASHEIIELGAGQVQVRYFGDVTLELAMDALAQVDVGLIGGFVGEGMRYVIMAPNIATGVQYLPSGSELPLDLLRLENSGLLSQPVFLHAMHERGDRTMVSIETGAAGQSFVLRQEI